MTYKYETHLHSSPSSACATAGIEKALEFYKKQNYDGVFLTNHFLLGNCGADRSESVEKQLDFYFHDYFEGLNAAKSLGIKLFCGVEITNEYASDFLVYGLSPDWYYEHTEILTLPANNLLEFLHMHKAFIVHAHPFRYPHMATAHIGIYTDKIDAVEIFNAGNSERENKMAKCYAEVYKFPVLAGSDNHIGARQKRLAGISTKKPIDSEEDFVLTVKSGKYKLFY